MPDDKMLSRFELCSVISASTAIVISFTNLVGWIYDIPSLTEPFAEPFVGSSTMKANSAFCFCLSGIILLLMARVPRSMSPRANTILILLLCTIVTIIAGGTLYEGAYNVNLGLDGLFIATAWPTRAIEQLRMGFASCSILIGFVCCTLLILLRRRYARFLSFAIAILLCGAAAFYTVGHLFELSYFKQIGAPSEVSLGASVCTAALGFGFLCLFPMEGPASLLANDTEVGYMVRRLMPIAIIAPPFLGFLALEAQRQGVFSIEDGLGLITTFMMIALTGSLYWIGRIMSRESIIRRHAEELQESESKYRAVTETAADAIISVDAQREIVYLNVAALQMFGYAEMSELMGQRLTVLISSRLQGSLLESFESSASEQLSSQQAHQVESIGVKANGSEFPLELSFSQWRRSDKSFLTCIIRDITGRKQEQKRLSEFYATISHELRTPFASIRAGLGILEMSKKQLPDRMVKVVELSRQECDRLTNLINDLLDLSKIEAGILHLHYDWTTSNILLERSIASVKFLADHSNIEIKQNIDANINIWCDQERIQQVLVNLLSNAVKFSPEQGEVILSGFQKSDSVRFEVQDEGSGIPEEARERLFDRFFQVRSSGPGNDTGTGLGLPISKAIVEEHGGTIGFTSLPSRGTMFWFELPGKSTE